MTPTQFVEEVFRLPAMVETKGEFKACEIEVENGGKYLGLEK